jgi:hypothetical protein
MVNRGGIMTTPTDDDASGGSGLWTMIGYYYYSRG